MKTDKEEYEFQCPYCKGTVKTNLHWLLANAKICCMSCNKAFEFQIQIKDDEEVPNGFMD